VSLSETLVIHAPKVSPSETVCDVSEHLQQTEHESENISNPKCIKGANMQTPLHVIEVNIKNKTGTDFFFKSKYIINDTPIEEKPLKIIEAKGSALIVRYLQEPEQPFSLYGMYEQYWRKENHVFQLADPDLYFDDISTLSEIKHTKYYKELIRRPINKTWDFGYWGLKN